MARVGPGRGLVAVDGVDGSGKTSFAATLTSRIAEFRPTSLVHLDDFHHPAALRHARGRTSAEGFWLDSYDYPAFHRCVVAPFRAGGNGRYVPAVFHLASDAPVTVEPIATPANAVLVVEGLFLHRSHLRGVWDASVFLDVPFAVTASRMAQRDGSHPDPDHPSMHRYVAGQRLYFAQARPWEAATYVVDNTDVHAARLIEAHQASAAGSNGPTTRHQT